MSIFISVTPISLRSRWSVNWLPLAKKLIQLVRWFQIFLKEKFLYHFLFVRIKLPLLNRPLVFRSERSDALWLIKTGRWVWFPRICSSKITVEVESNRVKVTFGDLTKFECACWSFLLLIHMNAVIRLRGSTVRLRSSSLWNIPELMEDLYNPKIYIFLFSFVTHLSLLLLMMIVFCCCQWTPAYTHICIYSTRLIFVFGSYEYIFFVSQLRRLDEIHYLILICKSAIQKISYINYSNYFLP